MINTRIISMDLGPRSYDIYIGAGLLYRLAELMPFAPDGRAVFIVTDENVHAYAERVKNILKDSGAARVESLVLPAGEQTKSFAMLEKLSGWFLEHNITRDSLILAVGGGVIGDLTGFCASVIVRGVPYLHLPTSLLAQVDSAVGGKTEINTAQGKNLVGSFYQPVAVVADIETLKTLPRRQLLAGYAEVVKYGLIGNSGFFNWLEENGEQVCALETPALLHAVETSLRAKAGIVQTDERETGRRALLNLGHTFGHALETAAGYDGRLLHGEAVAIGTVMAFDLSVRMGLCAAEDLQRVETHFTTIGLPVRASFVQPALHTSVDALYEIMGRDKKVKNGKLNLILANGIGDAVISAEAPEELIRAVLRDSLGGETSGTGGIKSQWGGR